jgi:hypothetical protein
LYYENTFTAELRKILTYKEELLTDVKNILYHRTDDVERLQKVVADTEEQFTNCLEQIKTQARRRSGGKRSWRTSGEPPRSLWTWWFHQKKAKQASSLCWNDFSERRKRSSNSSQRPRSRVSATRSLL